MVTPQSTRRPGAPAATPAPTDEAAHRERRRYLGAWATPEELVRLVVERTVTDGWVRARAGRPIRVLDPACGDGRFLDAARRRITALGGCAELVGVDVDPVAIGAARRALDPHQATLVCADALTDGPHPEPSAFDLVVGNPPFLSPLAATTPRRPPTGAPGAPYADSASEFLGLAVRSARPDGGRVALVLPQSVLAARDAGPVRREVERTTRRLWSWWSPERLFDADVLVCAVGVERDDHGTDPGHDPVWSDVVTGAVGVPALPPLDADGTLGDRATASANFRDEYYGLVPAVADGADGPPLVTTGLIDVATCRWGSRPVRFAKRRFDAPRVDLDRLDERMRRWAVRKLVPKVLVASQTAIVEAVADPAGAWLPAVPVTSVVPDDGSGTTVWEIAAVLTSGVATAAVWHAAAGTGLSARVVRVGPSTVAGVPWPAGPLAAAVAALRRDDVLGCARAVASAYGTDPDDPLTGWWDQRRLRAAGAGAGAGRGLR